MKITSKEDLKQALQELRKGKDDNASYLYTPPAFAMCYSIAFPRFRPLEVKGKHKCISCGKEFGQDVSDLISDCKSKLFDVYSKTYNIEDVLSFSDVGIGSSKGKSYIVKPCFEKYFNKRIRELSKSDIDSGLSYKEVGENEEYYKEKIVEELNSKKLTKQEFNKMLCDCGDNCYTMEKSYQTFINLVKEFKKFGFDAKLEFNCDDCVENGKNEVEFWLRLNPNDDYVISYPKVSYDREVSVNQSTFIDYKIVLAFLTGTNSYKTLIKNLSSVGRDTSVRKSMIDEALTTILGVNITYDKDEVVKQLNSVYKVTEPKINWKKFLDKVLDNFDKNKRFTMVEYSNISYTIDCIEDFNKKYLPEEMVFDLYYKYIFTLLGLGVRVVDEKLVKTYFDNRIKEVKNSGYLSEMKIDIEVDVFKSCYNEIKKCLDNGDRLYAPYFLEITRRIDDDLYDIANSEKSKAQLCVDIVNIIKGMN